MIKLHFLFRLGYVAGKSVCSLHQVHFLEKALCYAMIVHINVVVL